MPRSRRDRGGGARMESLYNSAEFRMYCFKVLECSKHYCHDWTECPFAHPGEKARRRDPRVFRYVGIECPQVKEGGKCPRGDLCPFAHNVFECWLHPTRYRTQLCNEPASCRRKVCFFAHTVEELREPTTGLENLVEASSSVLPAPHPPEQRASMDERRSSGDSVTDGSPVWSAPDVQQRSPQDDTLLAAAVARLRNSQPMGSSPELAEQLEQLVLLQTAGGAAGQVPSQAGGVPAPTGTNPNERVTQLLLLLLKEIAQARQVQGQGQMPGAPAMAPQPQAHRGSLDGLHRSYCPPTGQPHPHQHQGQVPRMSLDTLRRMSFSMLSSMGKGAGCAEGPYVRSPSMGRVSLDGSVPDFVLHDGRARAPSIDSNMSETLNMARAGRMSMDSSSSFLSGDRRSIEMGGDAGLLRFAGLAGDPRGVMADALVRRYEPRASVESCLSDGYLYRAAAHPGLHVPASSFPADM